MYNLNKIITFSCVTQTRLSSLHCTLYVNSFYLFTVARRAVTKMYEQDFGTLQCTRIMMTLSLTVSEIYAFIKINIWKDQHSYVVSDYFELKLTGIVIKYNY